MKILNKILWVIVTSTLCLISFVSQAQQKVDSIKLTLPINCTLDKDCFIQQLVDIDASEKAVDPLCGSATYNGHKGTDIRLRTVEDLKRNVEVFATANGTIKAVRNNVRDKLVRSNKDRDELKGIECGNGVVIDHGNNIETQYCHMKRHSVRTNVGDTVKAGDIIGYVGASGLTQFPHLHIALRKDGNVIDPFTGKGVGNNCYFKTDENWWRDQTILEAKRDAVLLDSNLTGAPIIHNSLVVKTPTFAATTDQATVGWVWYANLRKFDQVFIKLEGPNGFEVENLSKPLDRNKAGWSGYVGKKRKPQLGKYKLTSYIQRKGEKNTEEKISFSEKTVTVTK